MRYTNPRNLLLLLFNKYMTTGRTMYVRQRTDDDNHSVAGLGGPAKRVRCHAVLHNSMLLYTD